MGKSQLVLAFFVLKAAIFVWVKTWLVLRGLSKKVERCFFYPPNETSRARRVNAELKCKILHFRAGLCLIGRVSIGTFYLFGQPRLKAADFVWKKTCCCG